MIDNKVVVRRGKKFWSGSLSEDMVFTKEEQIDGIKGLPLITFYDFIIIKGKTVTKKEVNDLRISIGYTEIWVYDDVLPVDIRKWNKVFWKYNNHKCNRCIKSCKQSSRVILANCGDYEEKK